MASSKYFIAIVLIGFLMVCDTASSGAITDLLEGSCDADKFPYEWHEKDYTKKIVQDIVDNTPNADGSYFYRDEQYYAIHFYGHGECTQTLGRDDCSQCLKAAQDHLWWHCDPWCMGSWVQLVDCRI